MLQRLKLICACCSIVLLSAQAAEAAEKSKKGKKPSFPNVTIGALNYAEGQTQAVPGSSFPISITLKSQDDFPGISHYSVKVGFFLVKPSDASSVNADNLHNLGLYFGYVSLNSPKKGLTNYNQRIKVSQALANSPGEFLLYAMVDPWNNLKEKKSDNLYASNFPINISADEVYRPSLQITDFRPDLRGIILDRETAQSVNGVMSLEGNFSNFEHADISFCMLKDDSECAELRVWDPDLQSYSGSFKLKGLEAGEELTTLFDVEIPAALIDSLLPDIAKPKGDSFTLRLKAEAAPDTDKSLALSAHKDINLNLLPPIEENPYLLTDYGQDMREIVLDARKAIKLNRKSSQSHNSKSNKIGIKANPFKNIFQSIKKAIQTLVNLAKPPATPPPSRNEFLNQVGIADNQKLNIPGSRFNFPSLDFPWKQNLEVAVPPPPVRYSGNGFPSIEEYRRCIPFFCGPTNKADVGKAPSETCIRQYCGTTEQDLRYGGRNPTLLDIPTGFDYDYSKSGFGVRVGLSGRVNIFKDKAIINYVGGSYSNSAFFGVKVFGYSVPIFEAFSQAVYSPTEIADSYSQNVLKILGKTVEREEKRSDDLSTGFGITYGYKKGAEIGVGPFDVEVSVEAGGSLGVDFRITIGVDGITGSVEPSASIGAEATASAGIAGITGSIELLREALETALNLNVDLDIPNKSITPRLTLSLVNVLTGPNGSIKVFVDALFETFRITIASFSTGQFSKTIYDKSTTFAEIKL